MPHPKLKSENYQNFGGINSKASPYILGPHEFLDINNFDFSTPGSLTKRWGTTQYIGTTFTGKITALYEYERLDGFSSVIFGTGSSMYSLNNNTVTAITLPIGSGSSFQLSHGILRFTDDSIGAGTETSSVSLITGETYTYVWPMALNSTQIKDISVFQNVAVAADGNAIFKIINNEATWFQLPEVGYITITPSSDILSTTLYPISALVSLNQGTPFGYNLSFAFAYENALGLVGPITKIGEISTSGATFHVNGGVTYGTYRVRLKVPVPLGFGISYVLSYFGQGLTNPVWYEPTRNEIAAGGTFATCTINYNGRTNKVDYVAFPAAFAEDQTGAFQITSTGFTGTGSVFNYDNPKYTEIYNNQVFLGGVTTQPSTVFYTDIASVENAQATSNFEVRTNDGDRVTALKAFNSRLYVFKYNSMHELSGNDPESFNLREITDQYGCVNNQCTAVYNDIMLFLDKKGVMKFNGANALPISTKVQPIIDRVNQAASKLQSCMVHDKPKNQVLIAVPVDGATLPNLTIVYDYYVDAWTTYSGFVPSIFAMIKGRQNENTTMFGTYTALIMNFGATMYGDNGVGYTVGFRTRFLGDMGQSVQKMWRRLWLNNDVVTSSTSIFNIHFQQDFGTSFVHNATMFSSAFQSRIDFGVSAKSLAFQFDHFSATQSVKVHGFAIAHRYLRDV